MKMSAKRANTEYSVYNSDTTTRHVRVGLSPCGDRVEGYPAPAQAYGT